MDIPKKTKAAILFEQKKPLRLENITLPEELSYGQVLVKINYSGICGSQIGEIDGVKGEDKYLPHLLGHEGSGCVLKVGDGVSTVKVDDEVILHWREGDGINSALPTYMLNDISINAGWVTTFNQFAVISENRLTSVPQGIDQVHAPLLGCALTTGFGVIENDANLKIGESLVIFGSGGVGLSMIQAAKLRGAYPIIAVDQYESRLELAQKCGADYTLLSTDFDLVLKEIIKLTNNSLDVFIDNTGVPQVIESGYHLLKKTGKLILVGVPKFDKFIRIHSLPMHFGKTITGSEGGDCNPAVDIPKLTTLLDKGRLDVTKQVTKLCGLHDINDAISDMKTGKANGRIIIDLNA